MKVLLSTNIKDEHNYQEWIDYHLKMGFSHILLFDDDSIDPVMSSLPNVFIQKKHTKKKEYIESAVDFARKNQIDWMIHLDGDEYLYLGGKTVSEFLETIGLEVKGIVLPWLLFGPNGKITSERGKCIDQFTRCQRKTNLYTKTFARIDSVVGVKNAHVYEFQNEGILVFGDESPKPLNRNSGMFPEKCKIPTKDTVCIVHYYSQSWDIFKKRRSRTRDDKDLKWSFRSIDVSLDHPPPDFFKNLDVLEFPFVLEFYRSLIL